MASFMGRSAPIGPEYLTKNGVRNMSGLGNYGNIMRKRQTMPHPPNNCFGSALRQPPRKHPAFPLQPRAI